MFNDKFNLTQAVLNGTKTMTRRILKKEVPLGNWQETEKMLPYKVGEAVAIAQSYESIMDESVRNSALPCWGFADDHCDEAGWSNKMFVRADLMKHHIRIIDVKIERMQEISEEDILREGVWTWNDRLYYINDRCTDHAFDIPREAFAALIDKVSGKGTWDSNPWVVAYSFELVD